MNNDEEERQKHLQELQYTLQTYQNRYGELNAAVNLTSKELKDIEGAIIALNKLPEIFGSNILTNVGGKVYVNAKLEDQNNVVINIGASILIEISIEKAIEIIELKRSKTEQTLNKLLSQQKQVERDIYNLSFMIEDATKGQNV
ncbi:MAG: prefoldin subunit alpha [Candidatus Micrarchaeaceae archaeon]